MQKILCLLGPTASGKSAAALALAARLPIEIITLDSAQVYVGMDIGTAKPSAAERAVCPHHLIDLITPLEAYSAARFVDDCTRLVGEIIARNRVPVIAGGTMLYFKALREGLSALPGANPDLRAQLRERAQREGWPALHAELATHDPASAARLAPLDAQRIERALEIVLTTGAPVAHAQRGTPKAAAFELLPLALVPSDRTALHARIAARFDAMLREGLVDELAALKTRYPLHAELPAIRCVGYRQAWSYLEGEIGREAMRDQGIFATRQLAKRQLTWLRSTADLRIVDCLAADACQATVEAALRLLEGASGGLGADAFVW